MYAACSMTSAVLVSFESIGEVLQVPLRELARKTPLQKSNLKSVKKAAEADERDLCK
jgi:hypothetical protein